MDSITQETLENILFELKKLNENLRTSNEIEWEKLQMAKKSPAYTESTQNQ